MGHIAIYRSRNSVPDTNQEVETIPRTRIGEEVGVRPVNLVHVLSTLLSEEKDSLAVNS